MIAPPVRVFLWLAFELVVAAWPPVVFAVFFIPQEQLFAFSLACGWAIGLTWFFTRLSLKKFALFWRNDCMVFAEFVRYFRSENPVLANALWQKAHPNIPPPWLTSEATTGKSDTEV